MYSLVLSKRHSELRYISRKATFDIKSKLFVKWFQGLSCVTESSSEYTPVVGELTAVGRSMIERTCGRNSSENAGISSESKVRIFTVENLRFPGEGSSAQGKSGPKPRPKGVGDGQQVEIPVLPSLD